MSRTALNALPCRAAQAASPRDLVPRTALILVLPCHTAQAASPRDLVSILTWLGREKHPLQPTLLGEVLGCLLPFMQHPPSLPLAASNGTLSQQAPSPLSSAVRSASSRSVPNNPPEAPAISSPPSSAASVTHASGQLGEQLRGVDAVALLTALATLAPNPSALLTVRVLDTQLHGVTFGMVVGQLVVHVAACVAHPSSQPVLPGSSAPLPAVFSQAALAPTATVLAAHEDPRQEEVKAHTGSPSAVAGSSLEPTLYAGKHFAAGQLTRALGAVAVLASRQPKLLHLSLAVPVAGSGGAAQQGSASAGAAGKGGMGATTGVVAGAVGKLLEMLDGALLEALSARQKLQALSDIGAMGRWQGAASGLGLGGRVCRIGAMGGWQECCLGTTVG